MINTLMRPECEIQRAHDMIVGVLLDEPPLDIKDGDRAQLKLVASVLCWVLQHDHSASARFADILQVIEALLHEAGYKFPPASEEPNLPIRN